MAGGAALPAHAGDVDHALLHWQEEAHHHDDDGSYHLGDSGEAVAHVQLDGALQLTALLGPDLSVHGITGAEAPAFAYALHLPIPPPSQLRRPPRHLS